MTKGTEQWISPNSPPKPVPPWIALEQQSISSGIWGALPQGPHKGQSLNHKKKVLRRSEWQQVVGRGKFNCQGVLQEPTQLNTKQTDMISQLTALSKNLGWRLPEVPSSLNDSLTLLEEHLFY